MNRSSKQTTSGAAIAVAAPNAFAVPDDPAVWEKYAGVAMAGKNGCGTDNHACTG